MTVFCYFLLKTPNFSSVQNICPCPVEGPPELGGHEAVQHRVDGAGRKQILKLKQILF